jgi:3-oxoacyl-[acyl-carrier protein] reductase
MDLGIRGKSALVCGASKGLGQACAIALAREGVNVTIVARTKAGLDETAAAIAALPGASKATVVVCDLITPEGRAAALAACPNPDILINNCGGPPPGDFRTFTREDWIKALDANMLTPIEMIKAVVDGMSARGWGRIVNITSGGVKAPIDVLALSNGARSGLTGFVAGVARNVAKKGVTINNLLPGAIDTGRMRAIIEAQGKARGQNTEQATAARLAGIPAGRLGDPMEFGDTCAFLCSVPAAYITGQNLLLDGGAYPGTF